MSMPLRASIEPFADRLYSSNKCCHAVVGLDPHIPSIVSKQRLQVDDFIEPSHAADLIMQFDALVIECIADLVRVVKPQIAYYERFGSAGLNALDATARLARDAELLVLLDAKRGDIPSTSQVYAEAIFEPAKGKLPRFDAVTVSPYLGRDSVEPFVAQAKASGGCVFVCVKTSNPGAGDIQDLRVSDHTVAEEVAIMIGKLDTVTGSTGYSAVGAVVGSTYPDDALRLRRILKQSIFLVPGLGAQGGNLGRIHQYFNPDGRGALLSASRSVLYPKVNDSASLKDAIREEAMKLSQFADFASTEAKSNSQ